MVLPSLVFLRLRSVISGVLWRKTIVVNVDAEKFALAVRVDHKLDCRHLLLVNEWIAN